MKKVTIVLCLLGLGIFGFTGSEAKRDPFEPFIELKPPRNKEHLSPLERYEISQLKLIGIIGNKSHGYRALVEDKAGVGFILTEGTLVGSRGSKVNQIRRDRVIILEKYRDSLGNEKAGKVVWRLSNAVDQSAVSKAQGRKGSR
jgi:Tfp pilus assembly protein PilP